MGFGAGRGDLEGFWWVSGWWVGDAVLSARRDRDDMGWRQPGSLHEGRAKLRYMKTNGYHVVEDSK